MAAGKAGAQTHSGQANLEGVSSPRLNAARPPPTIPTTRDQPPSPTPCSALTGAGLWQPKPPSRRRPSHASLMNGFIPHLRSASKDPPAPRRRLSKLFALPHRALPRTAPFGDTYSTYHPSISGGAISSRYDATLPPLGFIARPRLFPPPVHAASGAGHRLQIARELELHKL